MTIAPIILPFYVLHIQICFKAIEASIQIKDFLTSLLKNDAILWLLCHASTLLMIIIMCIVICCLNVHTLLMGIYIFMPSIILFHND